MSPAPPQATIVFGTDGWRARIADDFTFDAVRRCADGVARYVLGRGEAAKGVVIAYDRRFASEHFAIAASEVLLAHGIPVAYAAHAVPTQMSSYEVVERGASAGIVITASHNPWTDNGFKVKAPTGSAGGPDMLKVIEAAIAADEPIERRPFAEAEAAGLVERFDPYEGYERYVRRTLDLDSLKAADVDILVEPMYGAGSGWIPRLLAGGRVRVTEMHQERNPYFGGINPEPIAPNINEALARIVSGNHDMGLLLDGDADRAGAADERGTFIHQLEVTGLLMYYLAEHRGLRDPVVVSVNNTSMAGRLGKIYGIETYETSVGFKYIGPKMIETGAMMGAEESGGYGFGMHLPERDGVYADLLLLDLFLRERERGVWPVSKIVAKFHELAGPSWYLRVDVHVEKQLYAGVKQRLIEGLAEKPPESFAGQAVERTVRLETNDGYKFFLGDGSWLLIRTSGTEPLVRVYTEATSEERRDALLKAGEQTRPWLRLAPVADVGPDGTALPRHVAKPWGHEVIWAWTDKYVGKILVLETGKRLSFQYHEQKDEWIRVLEGRLLLTLENEEGIVENREMGPGESARVTVGRRHRYEAIERCSLIEVSTPELEDVVRLQDDFGREGTKAP